MGFLKCGGPGRTRTVVEGTWGRFLRINPNPGVGRILQGTRENRPNLMKINIMRESRAEEGEEPEGRIGREKTRPKNTFSAGGISEKDRAN